MTILLIVVGILAGFGFLALALAPFLLSSEISQTEERK